MAPSDSGHLVPRGFGLLAGDVSTIAWLLNDYLRETGIDAPGSLAAAEYAQEAAYSDEYIPDPVLHVLLRAQHGLIAAADHLLGLAACIAAEDVVLASISLLRPVVTAAGVTYHLLDPDISVRERLRRGLNFELDSVREQLNSLGEESSPMWRQTARTRDRYLTWGSRHGFGQDTKRERFGEKRYWLTDGASVKPPPSDMKLAEDVLAALGDVGIGRAVYRFTSAFVHAQSHAFTMFQPAEGEYDPQTPDAVPLGLGLPDLTTWLMVAAMAVHTSAARCGRCFGWDLRAWLETTQPIFARWTADLAPASPR